LSKTIHLILQEKDQNRTFDFTVRQLFCGGFTGRDQDAVAKHIAEMASVGIPPPEKTPALYRISPELITTGDEIEVVGDQTSGEVEPVLLFGADESYLTVGSDETDREIEMSSYQKSKQICSKAVAKVVWRFSEVNDHYDKLILRSTVNIGGEEWLYQDGFVSSLIKPLDLLKLYGVGGDGTVLFSGTIPTKTGRLVYADSYQIKMIDPVLNRLISHTYNVKRI
jgi:hypothetical protein